MHIDRRRSPRIEMVGQLHVTSATPEQDIRVREISLGGMAIETSAPFEVGSVHAFRLTLGDESTVELLGRVMHSRPADPAEEKAVFVTGIQFVDEDPEQAGSPVEDIIKRVR